jgi:hypothetical protein
MSSGIAIFVFLSVGAVALFSFLAVAAWSDARRLEREAFYHSETMRKIAESASPENHPLLQLYRDEQEAKERMKVRKQREGLILGGLVNVGVGIALAAFLWAINPRVPVYLVGLFPLLIGAALLLYVYVLNPEKI